MGNQNDPKPPAPPPPASPTVADVMELVKAIQASQDKMAGILAEGIKAGMQAGMQMAAMAREQADLSFANARQARRNLGPQCPKCRMPVGMCGGPEMKLVPVLDAGGKPTLKDGKPVTKSVEATKPNEPDANHVLMVVMPDDREAARWFQWIGVNGIRFSSRRHGHRILVPRKNDFAHVLQTFQQFEQTFRQSRKVRFNRGDRVNPKPLHFAGRHAPGGAQGVRYVS